MRLIWHIVWKDLRRFALPLAAWLALVVGSAVWFAFAKPAVQEHARVDLDAYAAVLRTWVLALGVVQGVIGLAIAGALVLEDPVVGTDSFWQTRPIGRGRMLIAKCVAAATMLSLLPTIALLPLRWSIGYRWGELCDWSSVGVPLGAMLIASLCRTLGQFVGAAVAYLLVYYYLVAQGVSAATTPALAAGVGVSRMTILSIGFVVMAGALLVHQYLTRRTRRSWAALTAGVAMAVGVAFLWPWNIIPGTYGRWTRWRLRERSEDRAVDVGLAPTLGVTSLPPGAQVTMEGNVMARDGRAYLPVRATTAGDEVRFWAESRWGMELATQAILPGDDRPLRWRLAAGRPAAEKLAASTADVTGEMEIWAARARPLGETPLRADGEIVSGADRTRIVGLKWASQARDGRWTETLDGLWIEERGRYVSSSMGWQEARRTPRRFDRYLLLNRATGRVHELRSSGGETVVLWSQFVSYAHLSVPSIDVPEGWVLVRVRIEPERAFLRAFTVRGGAAAGEGNQP